MTLYSGYCAPPMNTYFAACTMYQMCYVQNPAAGPIGSNSISTYIWMSLVACCVVMNGGAGYDYRRERAHYNPSCQPSETCNEIFYNKK